MSVKHQLMTIAGVLLVGAVLNSSVMLYRLNEMSADARVVNQAGVVRGATQRLVKRELHGEPSDDLLSKIEKIISGLQSGSTDLHLPAATDAGFKSAMEQVAYSWTVLKETILDARENGDSQTTVYGRSEEFFAETDAAVTAAEEFAARKVNVTRDIQIVLTLINLAIVGSIILVTRRMTFTLHENISTLAATSTQIAATVDKHERVAADQATSMAETATTMEELDESSRLSASQAETGAQETSHSLALAEEGAQAVQQTVDAMTNLQAKMSSLSQQILALSERFDQIGELNTFVGELSNQTNLLAMNAAVEAAHAGQHGRGFAVVATEIRKLADQSGKSVSRIYNLVGDVQQAMSASVIATQEGSSVVEQATTLGRETAEVFKDLAKSVNVATESVQQLSLNNREQSSAINQIVEAVDSLNAGAREATSGIRKTSEDLHSLNQAVSNLQSMIGMTDARRGGEDAGSLTKIEVAPPLYLTDVILAIWANADSQHRRLRCASWALPRTNLAGHLRARVCGDLRQLANTIRDVDRQVRSGCSTPETASVIPTEVVTKNLETASVSRPMSVRTIGTTVTRPTARFCRAMGMGLSRNSVEYRRFGPRGNIYPNLPNCTRELHLWGRLGPAQTTSTKDILWLRERRFAGIRF